MFAGLIRTTKRALRFCWQLTSSEKLSRRVLLSKSAQSLGIPLYSHSRGISFGGFSKELSDVHHLVSEAIGWSVLSISQIPSDELKDRKLRGDVAFREGRYEDFFAEFKAIEDVRQQIRADAPTSISNLNILMSDWTGPFGNIGLIDQFLKHSRLRLPNSQTVLLTSLESSANPTLVSLFGKEISTIFLPKLEVSRLESMLRIFREPLEVRTSNFRCLDQYKWMEVADVEWQASERDPVLGLSDDIEKRGREILKTWGIQEDDWFVGLHVRDESTPGRNACNADIDTYLPAIREIIALGGHVVRLGSSDSKPLPSMKGLIDYAKSIKKSSWLDVFLMARCRFFIGTHAGPLGIPQIFGVPTLCTNSPHLALSMSMPRSVVIPKTLVDSVSGRVLTLAESMREPAAWTFSDEISGKVKRVDNTASEIVGGVREILQIAELGNTLSFSLSPVAQEIRKRENARGTIPISETFLESKLQVCSTFLSL